MATTVIPAALAERERNLQLRVLPQGGDEHGLPLGAQIGSTHTTAPVLMPDADVKRRVCTPGARYLSVGSGKVAPRPGASVPLRRLPSRAVIGVLMPLT